MLSSKLISIIPKEEQKSNGIYFTPPEDVKTVVDKLIELGVSDPLALRARFEPTPEGGVLVPKLASHLDPLALRARFVLEPSCGSCEFVRFLDQTNAVNGILDQTREKTRIDCYELNETIYKNIKSFPFKSDVTIKNEDFLKANVSTKYDLIIGNPPYYEIKYPSKSSPFFNTSKINVYLLFILKSLDSLKDNGVLAFVLPRNFLNNNYANKIRKHIVENYKLLWVHVFKKSLYLNTSQETCVIIVQNAKPSNSNCNSKYHIVLGEKTVFFNTEENIKTVRDIMKANPTNLHNLGFKVSVGNVIWNENKKILTDDSSFTRLVYNTDIVDNQLRMVVYKNKDKKNYIDKEGIKDDVIVVNRGHGTSNYKFNYALLANMENPYLLENHVLAIRSVRDTSAHTTLQHILESFQDPRTKEFVQIVFTNNAINVYELERVLPVFLTHKK